MSMTISQAMQWDPAVTKLRKSIYEENKKMSNQNKLKMVEVEDFSDLKDDVESNKDSIENVEQDLEQLTKEVNDIKETISLVKKCNKKVFPHVCPLCDGRGIKEVGEIQHVCQACEGKLILWG